MPSQPSGPGRPPSTTRRKLQQIALDLFSRHGYDEVTVEQLAAAAGISRRTFFRYFRSKADATMGDFDGDIERLRTALHDSDPGLPVMDAVRRAVVAVNAYEPQDLPELRQLLELQSSHPALLAAATLHYERWQAVIAEFAAGRLGLAADDLVPQVMARTAFGAAFAGFVAWLRDGGGLDAELDQALATLASGFDVQATAAR
ncbi:MAG TPA: TetR family transcriptional regulator [Actinomycetes bacterium]|nr:TetR family transcriptional regulator [Actinomycetes bacterium]